MQHGGEYFCSTRVARPYRIFWLEIIYNRLNFTININSFGYSFFLVNVVVLLLLWPFYDRRITSMQRCIPLLNSYFCSTGVATLPRRNYFISLCFVRSSRFCHTCGFFIFVSVWYRICVTIDGYTWYSNQPRDLSWRILQGWYRAWQRHLGDFGVWIYPAWIHSHIWNSHTCTLFHLSC